MYASDYLWLIFNPIVWVIVALPFIIHHDNKRRAQRGIGNVPSSPPTKASYDELAATRVDQLADSTSDQREVDILRRAASSIRLGMTTLLRRDEVRHSNTAAPTSVASSVSAHIQTKSPVVAAPTIPQASLAESGMKALQNINILLYLGAFFVVIAAGVFVSSSYGSLSDLSKVVFLAVFAAAFYGIGLTLFAFTDKIKPAGVTFTAIGLLVAPLVGAGTQALLYQGQNAGPVWMVTTAVLIVLQVVAYQVIRKSYLIYYGALTTISLFQSLTATLSAPVYWYGFAMLFTSLGYTVIARRVKDVDLVHALDTSAQIFVPLSVILSLLGIQHFGVWSVGSQLVLVAAFYLICAALKDFDQSPEELTYLALAGALFPVGFGLVLHARHVPAWAICVMVFCIAVAYLFGEKFAPESKHRPIFHNLATTLAVCAPFILSASTRSLAWGIVVAFAFHIVQWWVSRRVESFQLALLTFLAVPAVVGEWIVNPPLTSHMLGFAYGVCGIAVVVASHYFVRPRSKQRATEQDAAGLVLMFASVVLAFFGSSQLWLAATLGLAGATALFMVITESPNVIFGTVLAWHATIAVLGSHFDWSTNVQAVGHGVLAAVFYALRWSIARLKVHAQRMLVCYGAGLFLMYILGAEQSTLTGTALMAIAAGGLYASTYAEKDLQLPIVAATFASFGVVGHFSSVMHWYLPLVVMLWGTLIFGLGSITQGIRADVARWLGLAGVCFALLIGLSPSNPTEEWVGVFTHFMAGALVLAESVHQQHRAGKYIASALLWSATLHTYSTLDIDFAQLYWQTTAVYIAALAVRQRQRGDAEGEQGLTIAALLASTVPLAFQALDDSTGGYVLGILGLGFALLFLGMSQHSRLIRTWAISTLVVIALYKTAGYIFALPTWFWLGLIGIGALGGAMYLLSRRPHDTQ